MNEAESKIIEELRIAFGSSADKYVPAISKPAFNLGGMTPIESVSRGGCVKSAVGAISTLSRGC